MEPIRSSRIPCVALTAISTACLAFAAQAQSYQQLLPLPGGMQGAPILVSNNPESVNRAGLLLGMDAMNSTDSGKVTRRLTGVTTLDANCPSGGMCAASRAQPADRHAAAGATAPGWPGRRPR